MFILLVLIPGKKSTPKINCIDFNMAWYKNAALVSYQTKAITSNEIYRLISWQYNHYLTTHVNHTIKNVMIHIYWYEIKHQLLFEKHITSLFWVDTMVLHCKHITSLFWVDTMVEYVVNRGSLKWILSKFTNIS